MHNNIVEVSNIVIKDDLKYNGETVLSYKIEYPKFISSYYQMSLAIINSYYKNKALEYQKRCENELYKMAVEQYKFSVENGYPIRVFEALVIYKITLNTACIISLYFDQYEYTGGAHGNTLRYSQTYNLQRCGKINIDELITCPPNYKAYILREVKEQIKKNTDIYFDDYEKLIADTFNENSFYCTPQAIIVYYQQYDIAPYSSGIIEFFIPYSNCVANPVKKCFTTIL